MFATVERSFPTISATSCCVSAKSRISCSYPSASSIGFRSARWRFSTSASESNIRSSTSLTIAGIAFHPSRWAARNRRSPAMSSKPVPRGAGRTVIGCRSPFTRSDDARSVSSSSPNSFLGCKGFGRISPSGISRRADSAAGTGRVVPSRVLAAPAPSSRVGVRVKRASKPRPNLRPLSPVINSQLHDSFVSDHETSIYRTRRLTSDMPCSAKTP